MPIFQRIVTNGRESDMKKTKGIVRDRRKMKGKRVLAGILLAGFLAVTLAGCKNTDNTKEEPEKPVITLGRYYLYSHTVQYF